MKIRILLVLCLVVVTSEVCFSQNVELKDSVLLDNIGLDVAKKPVVISNRTVLANMKINNPVMFSHYQSGKRMQRTGIIMTGAGGGLAIMGAIFSILPDADRTTIKILWVFDVETNGDNSGFRKAGPVIMIAGAACLSAGIPVMIIGANRKKQTFQDYKNQYYLTQQYSTYFKMNIYQNKLGIAYVF